MKRLSGLCLLLLPLAAVSALPAADAPGDAGTVHLFNGKDLTHFYTYLKGYGRNNDLKKVFTVQDGTLRISGEVYGGLITEKEYDNYHLVAEFKWGPKTWAPRADKARDSGVLLHCVGADGAVGGTWMESIECQMIEGGTGDVILVGGKSKPSLTVPAERRDKQLYYKKGAPPVTATSGRFNWWGRDPKWKDAKGFRGQQDVEKPVGEWNRLECVCDGDRITLLLNGTVVNEGTQARPHRGKLLFQSEAAEVFFRRIDLKPIKK